MSGHRVGGSLYDIQFCGYNMGLVFCHPYRMLGMLNHTRTLKHKVFNKTSKIIKFANKSDYILHFVKPFSHQNLMCL